MDRTHALELAQRLVKQSKMISFHVDDDYLALARALLDAQAENDKLREALEYYADDKGYWENMEIDFPFRTTKINHDRGEKARQALADLASNAEGV